MESTNICMLRKWFTTATLMQIRDHLAIIQHYCNRMLLVDFRFWIMQRCKLTGEWKPFKFFFVNYTTRCRIFNGLWRMSNTFVEAATLLAIGRLTRSQCECHASDSQARRKSDSPHIEKPTGKCRTCDGICNIFVTLSNSQMLNMRCCGVVRSLTGIENDSNIRC